MNRVILVITFLVYQAVGINVMAFEKSISGQQLKQWSLVWGGDWRFGDYGVSVDNSGKARLMLFNTVNNENASGAGIVESQEGLYDRNAANEVRQALCDPSSQAGGGLILRRLTPRQCFWRRVKWTLRRRNDRAISGCCLKIYSIKSLRMRGLSIVISLSRV